MINLTIGQRSYSSLHVFGLWEEDGVSGETPGKENMQLLTERPRPNPDFHLEPSC